MPALLVLTPKGRAKLQNVVQAVVNATREGVLMIGTAAKVQAAGFAPSEDEEARLLSRGTHHGVVFQAPGRLLGPGNGGQGSVGSVIGTPEGGRFMRVGGEMSLREAIARDPVEIRNAGFRIYARVGRASRINASTSFHWNTRRRGVQGPTFPFNNALVQAFEYGGAVWIVSPRPGTRALEPEPFTFVRSMTKTVPPYQMYWRAANTVFPQQLPQFVNLVKNAARRVGYA